MPLKNLKKLDMKIVPELYHKRRITKNELYRHIDRWRHQPVHREDVKVRRTTRKFMRAQTESDKIKATIQGMPLPKGYDRAKAHDSGFLYRLTEEEDYLQFFEEGSP